MKPPFKAALNRAVALAGTKIECLRFRQRLCADSGKLRHIRVVLPVIALAACHPGPVTVDEDTVPDLPADDLPPPCEAPLIECGGECFDPMTSVEHCGFCDNACGGFENGPGATGGCSEGLCLAGWSGCQGASWSITCEDVCAAHSHVGFVCVENGCGVDGGTILWTSSWWVDDGGFGGGHGEEGCTLAQAENPVMLQQVGCAVPIADAFAASGIVEQQDYRYVAQCCCDDPDE